LITIGMLKYGLRELRPYPYLQRENYPRVSCIVTCYAEGKDVYKTIQALSEQLYPGYIEIIAVIDGALQNAETLQAARQASSAIAGRPRRKLLVLPKWQRGGRVSSLNAGLEFSSGEIILALDGDTSFDNDMVVNLVRHFQNPLVPGVAGSLRVRNARRSFVTAMQALEYLLSIHLAKIGLSEWNVVNNISGAFGAFRRSFLEKIGGWDTHTAEDLDITLRIKNYFGRKPLRIPFEPRAMGHTDVPVTFRQLLMQRLRWDGDLFFLYIRKHRHSFTPGLLGWRNFIVILVSGFFFQLVLPFIIFGYLLLGLYLLSLTHFMVIALLVYLVYLANTLLAYVALLTLVSERPREDLWLCWAVPLFPLFMLVMRCWSAVAILNEMLRRAHEESSMAPWWVLRKGKKF